MSAALLLMLAPSACTAERDVPDRNAAPAAADRAPAPGRIVTEIDPRIWCMHQDRAGNHWFGSNGNGVYRFDGRRVTNYTRALGLSGDQVRDIEEDSTGRVLISTTDGVSRFDGTGFTTLEPIDAPFGSEGWSLEPDDAWLVLGSGDSGPGRFDGERLYRLQLPRSPAEDAHRARHPDAGFSPSGVYSIHRDRRGHVWFGTAAAGLWRYDGRSLGWMYEERLTTTPGGGAFGIRSIHQDRAGDYWICNTRQRFEVAPDVVVDDGYGLIRYGKKEGLPGARGDTDGNFGYVMSMAGDVDGALWMACGHDGVWKYDGDDVTRYPIGDGAYAIVIDADRSGRLWLGTLEHGIRTFDGERFVPFAPGAPGAGRDARP